MTKLRQCGFGSSRGCKNKPLRMCWKDKVKILGILFTYDTDLMWSLNYDDKIKKLGCIINLWKQRDLSPIGKVTIMKSYGLSQLLYTSSMISMPESIQKRVNALVFSYIWNGPDKIKRSVATADYDCGGLKMFNLKARVQAQNVLWVKRFFEPYDAGWKEVLKFYLNKRGGSQMFISNMDLSKVPITLPPFYHQVFALWSGINSKQPITPEEIQNQMIWNNRFILIGQKSVFYSMWSELGLNKIRDLLDDNGQFLDFNSTGLHKGQFLKWYGVISSIPILWRKNLGPRKIVNPDGDMVGWYTREGFKVLEITKSRDLYNHFNVCSGEAVSTYRMKQNYHFDDNQCVNAYVLPLKVTLDCKLRWMQFSIIHNILPTNSWLYKVGLRNDGLCPFCHLWCDLCHLFWECETTSSFMQEVKTLFPFFPVLSSTEIMYGIFDMKGNNILINHMILIFKKCVFKSCGLGQRPSISHFKNVLCDTYRLEKVIAQKKNKLDFHYRKWGEVVNQLNL